ncbi:MAG: septation protein A [Alphaproteobacteria bacterium]|nr:septation protein A [Alphaproteobacteria bacterium]MDP7053429.1 septation protein A [Alphaproteobacteria bacterium]MDP7229598.1 septation protein A [Alphaproteobacteria bacterium]MDP7462475.1 septation protein A [Alphaproteobacteria bacterium]MEE1554323.1 septation protein A [Alphaproteobacteria bacterium]
MSNSASAAAPNPLLKLALEIGPLALFFLTNAKAGIFWATAVFMVAILVSLTINWLLERRVPTLPLVTGIFVLVFGGLTLILQDELFIKLKPTIVNTLFAVILFGGLFWGKSFLKSLMGSMFRMTDLGWRMLTIRWALFFVLLAVLNEIVWRNTSTDTWVSFKVFGIMPLTILFSLSQLPAMNRHQLPNDEPGKEDAA